MTAPLAPDDPRHGSVNAYGNLKCRCDDCRAAWAAAYREKRANWAAHPLPPGDSRHGTNNGYANYGCRCMNCTIAHRHVRQQQRSRTTNPKEVS